MFDSDTKRIRMSPRGTVICFEYYQYGSEPTADHSLLLAAAVKKDCYSFFFRHGEMVATMYGDKGALILCHVTELVDKIKPRGDGSGDATTFARYELPPWLSLSPGAQGKEEDHKS